MYGLLLSGPSGLYKPPGCGAPLRRAEGATGPVDDSSLSAPLLQYQPPDPHSPARYSRGGGPSRAWKTIQTVQALLWTVTFCSGW